MPTYELAFAVDAKKEWDALDGSVKQAFKKVLARRLEQPRVATAKLRGAENRYKIKLRDIGYRLAYEVEDNILTVVVIVVGRRDKVYQTLAGR